MTLVIIYGDKTLKIKILSIKYDKIKFIYNTINIVTCSAKIFDYKLTADLNNKNDLQNSFIKTAITKYHW